MARLTRSILLFTLGLSVCGSLMAAPSNDRPKGAPDFSTIDTNGDGVIDFDEFSSHPIPHGDHETIFNNIDTDQNGEISKDELSSHKPPRPKR